MASGKLNIKGIYDKLLALVGVVLFVLMLLMWFTAKGKVDADQASYTQKLSAMKPKNAQIDMTEHESKLKVYTNDLVEAIVRSKKISVPPKGEHGFFVPEQRAWCAFYNCQASIPLTAEECLKCGKKQPTKQEVKDDPTRDMDKDGMPDTWEIKYKLDPYNPADASSDNDNDGFTNLDEYKAGTDPLDPKSHTDTLSLLCLTSIEVAELPLLLEKAQKLPDGTYRCQFKYADKDQKRTVAAKTGEAIRWRLEGSTKLAYGDTGFELVRVDIRKEKVYKKHLKQEREENVAVAIVKRVSSGREIELRENVEAVGSDYFVTLTDAHTGDVYEASGSEGEAEFEIDKKIYKLKKVDKSQNFVLIESISDKKEFTISSEPKVSTEPVATGAEGAK